MAFIDWSDDLSTGMKDIDEQHKKFIGTINKAKQAADSGAPRKAQKDVIEELAEYGRYHFDTEEKYFKKFNYPYAKEHEAEHAKLLAKVLYFSNKFDSGQDVAIELLDFLKGWLADHLMKHDMKYAKYFKSKGYI
jgi:hemerythrin-like metal-binding protein